MASARSDRTRTRLLHIALSTASRNSTFIMSIGGIREERLTEKTPVKTSPNAICMAPVSVATSSKVCGLKVEEV